jgi:uncharacterized protein (UPF0548 family)
VISLRRPTEARIVVYRDQRINMTPPCPQADGPPPGFHRTSASCTIGTTQADFERARAGLRNWAAHRGSGIEIWPDQVELVEGETVAIVTRQLGLWVTAACRITTVIDRPDAFSFTYATLPDHPECGYESFILRRTGDDVVFEIEAVSKPGIALGRLASPITRQIQERATDAYLSALARVVGTP